MHEQKVHAEGAESWAWTPSTMSSKRLELCVLAAGKKSEIKWKLTWLEAANVTLRQRNSDIHRYYDKDTHAIISILVPEWKDEMVVEAKSCRINSLFMLLSQPNSLAGLVCFR